MPTRLLVVDDQPAHLENVLDILRQQDFEITLASRGEQALTLVEQVNPDLILIDSYMPDMSGLETCQHLRQNLITEHVPILLMSGLTVGEARAESLQAGANEFILKPINPMELQQRIVNLLNLTTNVETDNQRLLDETCQGALVLLPCCFAWLLSIENGELVSRVAAAEDGPQTVAAFFQKLNNGLAEHPVYPIRAGQSPITDAVLNGASLINITLQQVQRAKGGSPLFEALQHVQSQYTHFLPLNPRGQTVGILILGARESFDRSSPQRQRVMGAIVNQAATAVENARLVSGLAVRQDQMRAEQNFRKMVLDMMGDGLVVIDAQANIRFINNRLLRMTGYLRQELFGQSIGVIFHPNGREQLVRSLQRQGRTTVNFMQQLVTKTGGVVPVQLSRGTGSTDTAEGISTILVLRDISDQRRREQALERQSERLQMLNRAAQAIASALSAEDVVTGLLQSASEIIGSVTTCLFLHDEAHTNVFKLVGIIGPQGESLQELTIEVGEGIAGRVVSDYFSQFISPVRANDNPIPLLEREGAAVIAVPLVVMGQAMGVLEVIDKVEGNFLQEDVEVLENLAAAASVAIENSRLFAQTQRRVNELSALLEASSAASSTLEIGRVLELISRRLMEAMGVARCQIGNWDRSNGSLNILVDVANGYWEPEQGPNRPANVMGIMQVILNDGKPVIAQRADPALDTRLAQYLTQMGVQHTLLFPLRYGTAVVGLLELHNAAESGEFTARHIQAVEDCVVRWREQVRKHHADLWYDRDSLTDLYQRVARATEATWSAISFWDREDHSIRLVREVGFVPFTSLDGTANSLHYPLNNDSAMSHSMLAGESVVLSSDEPATDPEELRLFGEMGYTNGLIVPLLIHGEGIGLVRLMDNTPRQYDNADLSLCQAIANVIANALENAQLYQSLERRADALQNAFDELRLSDKVKDALLQNLSHELQTPLHQVIMQLDLINTEAFGPINEEQKQYLQDAINRVNHVGETIRDMVSLRTLDIHNVEFAPTKLPEIVKKAIESKQEKAGKMGLKIVHAFATRVPLVRADAERVREAVEQLLDNAIKFSPRAERKTDKVEVHVKPGQGPMVEVTVQDYGIGIPDNEFDKIFHKGYQVDGSMTRRYGGSGLGLAVVRQIIDIHGGKVWVESTVGQGSKFTFTLPRAEVS